MKKSARNRIIIWSVVSVLLIGLLISGMTFFKNMGAISFGNTWIGTDFSDYKSGNAEFEAETVKRININWTSGNVRVVRGTSNKVKISEVLNSSDETMQYHLDSDGTLKIYDSKREFKIFSMEFFSYKRSKELTVQVPSDAKLLEIDVSTASAGVKIESNSAEELSVSTASGNIELFDVDGKTLDLDTVSGEIDAKKCTYTDIEVNSISGRSEINTYSNCHEFAAESVSGDIIVCFDNFYSEQKSSDSEIYKISAASVSGAVEVNLPVGIKGFTAELDSISGYKNVNFDVLQKNDKIIYGNGESKIDIETVSGAIEINKVGEKTEHIYE